jgi:hypothetical protein
MVAEDRAEYGNPKPHRREVLEQYVEDFNELFGEKHNIKDTESFTIITMRLPKNRSKTKRIFCWLPICF